MSAGEFALVVAAVLCCVGFAALIVVLGRVIAVLAELRAELANVRGGLDELRAETSPLLGELRSTVDSARADLDRFDKVIGSAEVISESVEGLGRTARTALSAPVIKTVAFASGTGRAAKRLKSGPTAHDADTTLRRSLPSPRRNTR